MFGTGFGLHVSKHAAIPTELMPTLANAKAADRTNFLITDPPQNTNQKNERQRTVVDWTKGKSSTIGVTNLLLPVRCMPSAFESNSVVRRRKQLRRADTDTTKKPRPNGLTRLRD